MAQKHWRAARMLVVVLVLLVPAGCISWVPPEGDVVGAIQAVMTAIPAATLTAAAELTITAAPTPTEIPTPTRKPAPTSFPTTAPTEEPAPEAACEIPLDSSLQAAYKAAGGFQALGCPAAGSSDEYWAIQPFEHGLMLWRAREKAVYLAYEEPERKYAIRADLWNERMPEFGCAATPPAGYVQPKRGFGHLWCDTTISQRLGWAVLEEYPVTFRVQRFANAGGDWALLLVPPWGQAFAFYTDQSWSPVMTVTPQAAESGESAD